MSTAVTNTVTNTIVIEATPGEVWRASTDIERWPDIFATVRAMRKIPAGADEVIMEMTVVNDLGENTVRSHRRYLPELFRIDFEMWTLPAAIAAMDGDWTIEQTGEGARLSVVHNFVPRHDGEVGAAELAAALSATTDDVLGALKTWVETAGAPVADGLRDAWGPRTASNGISAKTFENCELFFSRLVLAGLDWGDITIVLSDLKKESTHGDWTDWHRRWSDRGAHYEDRADEALAAGFTETARIAFQRAAACHHYAEFFFFDNTEVKQISRARVTDVFDRSIPYLREAVTPLTIPYGDLHLPGYLMAPQGEGPWPCVFLINGLDSAKEVELYAFAREFIARGMCVVVFDGPGQGLLTGQTPMSIDFENVVAAVLDRVRRLPEVDNDRIGLFGVSFGGYLAARAASAVKGFQACVNLSGGFDHDNYPTINSMVRTDFRYVFGVEDDAEMEEICRKSLHLRDNPPLTIPLLAIHGELDSIIPMESCERMLDWAAGETELIRYEGERHVATNYFGDFIPRFTDWMADRLGATTS
jgi:dienelactone hydrolase